MIVVSALPEAPAAPFTSAPPNPSIVLSVLDEARRMAGRTRHGLGLLLRG